MIVYFIGSDFRQKASATTESEKARVIDDMIVQNVNGLSTLELDIQYQERADSLGQVGEFIYIPAETKRDASFFQIITKEVDYINKTVSYYADTNFLWFSSQNTKVGITERDGTYGRVSEIGKTIAWFLDEFLTTSAPVPYTIGVNEISNKLATGDTNATTAKEALDKTAALFGVEIVFSFDFDGSELTPYIDIYERYNGEETGETLTVGKEITELTETVDASEIATAVKIRGVVSSSKDYETEDAMLADTELEIGAVVIAESIPWKIYGLQTATAVNQMTDPTTVYKYNNNYYLGARSGTNQPQLTGWETQNNTFALNLADTYNAYIDPWNDKNIITELPEYDDGEYYTSDGRVYSRSAWYRFGNDGKRDNARFSTDIIIQSNDLDTTDPEQILQTGLALLEVRKEPAITYDCKCLRRVALGSYYTIVVPGENVYITARCLETQKSETRGEFTPTFGNYWKSTNAFEVMARNAKGGF